MANRNTIGSVLKDAGVLTIKGDRCQCKVCKATGRAETLIVKHKPDCYAFQAVSSFIDKLHDDEFILPEVESPIDLGVMLPYYADVTREEFEAADAVATAMFAAATEKDRQALVKRVLKYEPACNSRHDLLDAVVKCGLETNSNRLDFRSWLIFMHAHERSISRLEAEHYEMECEATEVQDLFDRTFHVK